MSDKRPEDRPGLSSESPRGELSPDLALRAWRWSGVMISASMADQARWELTLQEVRAASQRPALRLYAE
jgi:hypothetical protein